MVNKKVNTVNKKVDKVKTDIIDIKIEIKLLKNCLESQIDNIRFGVNKSIVIQLNGLRK